MGARQIAIISGKGGTGKTMLSASFAVLAKSKVVVDCDVDAANLYLLLQPAVREMNEFKGGLKARLNRKICNECGKCRSVCRFNAIDEQFLINPIDCEGCGLCARICPSGAITMQEAVSGKWFVCATRHGPFVYAKLGAGEGNSGKLVSLIRSYAVKIAEEQAKKIVIIDGPPGIGCPVIASLSGADLAIAVTEPTPTGIHDMERVFALTRHFKIPVKVVINKFDLNAQNTKSIESFSKAYETEVVGCVPFSADVSKAIVEGVPPVEFCHNGIRDAIVHIWQAIERI